MQVLKTKYLVVHYLNIKDLCDFDSAIEYSAESNGFTGFLSSGKTGMKLKVSLPKKLDPLFEKVQLILEMRKASNRVRVNIYPNESLLHKNDLNEHMLAHEIVHAIIDYYVSVRPPRAIAIDFSRVDKHLLEEEKQY